MNLRVCFSGLRLLPLLLVSPVCCLTVRAQAVASTPYGLAGYLPPQTQMVQITPTYTGTTFPYYFFYGDVMPDELYHGRFSGQDGLTLIDQDAAWSDNQYGVLPGNRMSSNYIEITSGPFEGLCLDVMHSGASTLTVDRLPAGASVVGETYVLRTGPLSSGRGWLLTLEITGFYGPGYSTVAAYGFWDRTRFTEIESVNAVWRDTSTGATVLTQPPESQMGYFKFTQPSYSSSALNYGPWSLFTSHGHVQAGPLGIWVDPGYNLINPRAVKPLTLGTSNLYTGDPTTGVKAGTPTTADIVSVPNGPGFDDYYMRQTAAGVVGWRRAGNVASDCANVVLAEGSSFILRRRPELSAFVWYRPAFYPRMPGNLPAGTPLPASASDPDAISYDEWAALTIGAGDRSPTADDDGDGRPNLLEYFLGTNPLVRDAAVIETTAVRTNARYGSLWFLQLKASVPRDVKDVAYAVEGSYDLDHWSEVVSTSISQYQGMNEILGVDWSITNPTGGVTLPGWIPRRYLRLVVRLLNRPETAVVVPMTP